LDHVPRGEEIVRLFSVWGSKNLLFGGGSIFSTTRSIRWKYRIARIHSALHPSGRRGLLGVSIGPFDDDIGEKYATRLLLLCDFAVVRDSRSYEWAQSAVGKGLSNIQIPLSPDLTFALRAEAVASSDHIRSKTLVVALRGDVFSTEESRAFLGNLAVALRELIDSGRVQHVKLMSFQVGRQSLDSRIARELESRISRDGKTSRIDYDGDPLRALREIATCELVIGMRLHAKVFAEFIGNKLVSICYHQKDFDFIRDWTPKTSAVLEVSNLDIGHIKEVLNGKLRSPYETKDVALDLQKLSELL
jgi:polysaccharide pyruvyl transferase WcaK-like protein